MRVCLCDLCGDLVSEDLIINLKTCNCKSKGLSLEICSHCEDAIQAQGEGIAFDLLFKEEKKNAKKD